MILQPWTLGFLLCQLLSFDIYQVSVPCTFSSYLFVYRLIDVEMVEIEFRALCTPGKHPLSDLCPQSCAHQVVSSF